MMKKVWTLKCIMFTQKKVIFQKRLTCFKFQLINYRGP